MIERIESADIDGCSEVLRLSPNDTAAMFNLAMLMKDHTGEYTEAASLLHRAILYNPKYGMVWNGVEQHVN